MVVFLFTLKESCIKLLFWTVGFTQLQVAVGVVGRRGAVQDSLYCIVVVSWLAVLVLAGVSLSWCCGFSGPAGCAAYACDRFTVEA